jgi:hypothetical protein
MSFGRVWRPSHGGLVDRGAVPRVDRRPEVAPALHLQRTVGNRRTRALLRSPGGDGPTFTPLSGAFSKGGLDASSWREKAVAAKEALNRGKREDATRLYVELYQDLARTAGAEVVADVAAGYPINIAKADDTEYRPGLNLVLGSGGATGGTTAFVDSSGTFGVRVSLTAGATQPRVAIRLYGGSFNEDKAMSLDLLRHEMTHAKHLETGLASVGRWLKAGGKGDAEKFGEWLKGNRKGLSDADVALGRETARGLSANTEVLAYVEGFMTSFHLVDPPPPVDHPIFLELLGVLETRRVLPWKSADQSVQDLAARRLEKYYCETLDAPHRSAFDAWVQAQTKRVRDDEAALKSKSDSAEVFGARARRGNAFAEFIKRLQPIPGKCAAAKKPAASRALQRKPDGPTEKAEQPVDIAKRLAALLNTGKPGDEARASTELGALDKDQLQKVDDAAATLPRGAGLGLRRKISYLRHAPADAAAGTDDLEVTASGRDAITAKVDGGTVKVTEGTDATWSERTPKGEKIGAGLKNAVAFRYDGADAKRAHWIQFIWREIIVTDPRAQKTWMDERTKNSAGVEYALTPKGAEPRLAVDRGTLSEPWYEHKSPRHRDAGTIAVADVPSAHEDFVKKGLDRATAGTATSIAHLVTYLVKDDRVLFRVATDATYVWTRDATSKRDTAAGPTYAVKGAAARKLDPAHRAALVRDFPDMDYLP